MYKALFSEKLWVTKFQATFLILLNVTILQDFLRSYPVRYIAKTRRFTQKSCIFSYVKGTSF